jgi:hypothetical protein
MMPPPIPWTTRKAMRLPADRAGPEAVLDGFERTLLAARG